MNDSMVNLGSSSYGGSVEGLQAEINAEKQKSATSAKPVNIPGVTIPSAPSIPGAPDLASMMRDHLSSPAIQELTAHPDFPALAGDNGVQALVTALTNQVGHVLNGIKGSGQNIAGITLD